MAPCSLHLVCQDLGLGWQENSPLCTKPKKRANMPVNTQDCCERADSMNGRLSALDGSLPTTKRWYFFFPATKM